MYEYNAKVIRVVDGDTVRLQIDLGFTIRWISNCRLHGLNTPELNDPNPEIRIKALEAKQYLIDNLPEEVKVISRELDKYGRPLLDVYYNGKHLNQELLQKGLAVKI